MAQQKLIKAHKSSTCPVKFLYPKVFWKVENNLCGRPLKICQPLKTTENHSNKFLYFKPIILQKLHITYILLSFGGRTI